MVFVETYAFTKHIPDCFGDEEYREFQSYLMKHPEEGVLIRGTGGLRKIRWAARNKGKRGGSRIIYYWHIPLEQIYLFDLTPISRSPNYEHNINLKNRSLSYASKKQEESQKR
jgi:mRNA-degrading endonuclease RelE of RelBE toxin-antitoxin system